jgi:hypothetical protein
MRFRFSFLSVGAFTVCSLICLFIAQTHEAGAQDKEIIVEGRVYDIEYPKLSLEHLMIISRQKNRGIFADSDNRFSIKIQSNDTLLISASGYELKKISFRDSMPRERYIVNIPVKKLVVELKGITIDRKRELKEIEDDIAKLGYSPKDFRLHGTDAWMSPITALYEEFSKKARARRQVAEWMNRDNRNTLLKELFRYYERAGLMQLPEDRYDDFITYLNFTDEQLQRFSQYDLAVYIRNRYYHFAR